MAQRSSRQSGDDFMAQVRQCDDRMRALAWSVLGSADAMDDVLHDAYLKAFRGYHRFRGDSSFATWLGAIVYRCCLDHQRTRRRRPALTPGGPGDLDQLPAPGPDADAITTRLDVAAALQRLSPDHRAVLVLVDLQGQRLTDAARILDVPKGTVASRLARARTALRAELDLAPATSRPTDDHPAPEATR